ncbi:DinB family protein [Nevskia ramosa]|uniref:DinB family protein n=1 Tax=Nevskia ramosa TaxID=64002 RepID=UPI003D0BF660
MTYREHLRAMAGWNRWCHQRLFAVADGLSDEDYRRDVGLFFKSVHGSINHLLLADLMWQSRLAGAPLPINDLAMEVEADRAQLKVRMLASADEWLRYVDATPDELLFADFDYRSTAGSEHRLPRSVAVHTMFTHGAHHRGQVSTALSQLGCEAPVFDFPIFYFDYAQAKSALR